jgi:hypothetical protein
MRWLFHRQRFGKKTRFFITENRGVRMRWLNGSRTLPLVTKPIFCDLGGPVVEFIARLDRTGGFGRLLRRSEFLERAGLQPLDDAKLHGPSHHEVRWPERRDDGLMGVVAPSEDDLNFWQSKTSMQGREVRSYRLDGTFATLALAE